MWIRNYLPVASYINNNNMYVILLWRPVHYLQITNYQMVTPASPLTTIVTIYSIPTLYAS